MKKVLILGLAIFSIIIITVIFSIIKGNHISKINLYKFSSFTKIDDNQLIKTIEDTKDIETVESALNNAKRVDMSLSNIAFGTCSMKIITKNNKFHGYYICIIKEQKSILIIDANETNTGYEMQNKDFEQAYDILTR